MRTVKQLYQLPLFDVETAQLARDAGIRVALAHAQQDFRGQLELVIKQLARSGDTFTADDVRRIVGETPAGQHFNIVGAVFAAAAKADVIEFVDYAKSANVVGHGNLIRRWRGKQ